MATLQTTNRNSFFGKKNDGREILRQNIEFSASTSSFQTYLFDTKKERKILELSENNTFIYITIVNKTSLLKFYIIDSFGNKSEKQLDFSELEFSNSNYKKATLYDLLNENLLPFESAFNLQKISSESPVPLTFSSKKRKYYFKDNTLTITFDSNLSLTQILSIDFNDFTFKKIDIKKPYIYEGELIVNSNSFIYNDQVYLIKLSEETMYIIIKDFNNNIIKEYVVSKDDEIDFKNSKIIQIGTEMGSGTRILDKTSQFLRKVSTLNSGISCYQIENDIHLTIGSVSEVRNNNAVLGGMFGVTGVLISHMITNPVYDNFNAYANRKVVYINSILDKNGNHVNKAIKETAFDKMQHFSKENSKLNSQTIFKLKNNYYFGYYDSSNKKYSIIKFLD